MPLGERAGFEKSQSRYCGVETEFNDNVPQLLNFNLSTGAFDFVVAPLMNPSYRPSLLEKGGVLPFAAPDLVLSPSPWSSHVVGKISSWIDLDSEDETLRMDSETTLKQEIAWVNHLSIQVWYEWCVTSPDHQLFTTAVVVHTGLVSSLFLCSPGRVFIVMKEGAMQ